jgi:integrase
VAHRTITTINYRVVIAPPKTDRSRRRNKLDPETVAVLTAHRERQDAERRAAGLRPTARTDRVFANVLGEPPHPDWITARFKVLVREAGLRPLKGPHALRHTWASLALAEGVHPKVVSDRLGHSTIAITIDTYSHVMPSLDEEAAGTVANLIFRKKHRAEAALAVGKDEPDDPTGADE